MLIYDIVFLISPIYVKSDTQSETEASATEYLSDEDITFDSSDDENGEDLVLETVTENINQSQSPLLLMEEDKIAFEKNTRFLVKIGISEEKYKKFYLQSSFHDPELMPETFRTCKRRLFNIAKDVLQVVTVLFSLYF
jgi:hypothetical protein